MFCSYMQKNKYLNSPKTSLFDFQSDYEKKSDQILWNFTEGSMNNPSSVPWIFLDSEAKISEIL